MDAKKVSSHKKIYGYRKTITMWVMTFSKQFKLEVPHRFLH